MSTLVICSQYENDVYKYSVGDMKAIRLLSRDINGQRFDKIYVLNDVDKSTESARWLERAFCSLEPGGKIYGHEWVMPLPCEEQQKEECQQNHS